MVSMQEYLSEVQKSGQVVNPLFNFLGMEVVSIGEGEARLRLPLTTDFVQGAGVVAGGMVSTLLAETMAHAVISVLPEGASTAAAEMSTRYLRMVPAPGDGEMPVLTATARVVRRGSRVVAAEASAFLDEDRPNAMSMATFLVMVARSSVAD